MIPKNTRFGHLVVIGPAQPVQVIRGGKIVNWSASWCRCQCGASRVVPDWRLRTGHVTSCGCRKLSGLAAARHTRIPRIGTRFGELTVTAHLPDRIDRRGIHHTRSEFTCSCGRMIALDNSRVRRLHHPSCGHDRPAAPPVGRPRHIRLVRPNARFGSLVVVGCRLVLAPYPVAYATVRCNCGSLFETWVENLRLGRVFACPACSRHHRGQHPESGVPQPPSDNQPSSSSLSPLPPALPPRQDPPHE